MPKSLRPWRAASATPQPDPVRIARLERELGIGDGEPFTDGRRCLMAGWGDALDSVDVVADEYGRISLTSETGSYGLGAVTPGQGGYRIQVDMGFRAIGPNLAAHSGLYFGRASANPYQFGAPGTMGGYHLAVRQSGRMRLYRHAPGAVAGIALGEGDVHTAAPKAGEPMTFEIDVTPETVEVRRLGDPPWTTGPISDDTHRGGHFGLSNGSVDNPAARPFWDYLVVTEL
ncbi:hypothetical protein [Streptomyces sp. CFMR 7]|uniref:hypothetical protein n=1 Tax=Streptomyces sp. CFMR 7 TaxID=1649184 RepID=UPI00119FCEF3|nr:hypothetical protein [Streptomyces sp. CFMR 7]